MKNEENDGTGEQLETRSRRPPCAISPGRLVQYLIPSGLPRRVDEARRRRRAEGLVDAYAVSLALFPDLPEWRFTRYAEARDLLLALPAPESGRMLARAGEDLEEWWRADWESFHPDDQPDLGSYLRHCASRADETRNCLALDALLGAGARGPASVPADLARSLMLAVASGRRTAAWVRARSLLELVHVTTLTEALELLGDDGEPELVRLLEEARRLDPPSIARRVSSDPTVKLEVRSP